MTETNKISMNVYTTATGEKYDILYQVFSETNDIFQSAGVLDSQIEFYIDEQTRFNPQLIIATSKRMTRTVGKCEMSRRDGFKIVLQDNLVDWKYFDDLKSVFCHEVIHMLYPLENHGGKFKECMDTLNEYDPSLHITATYDNSKYCYVPQQKKQQKEYVLKCPECGKEWHFHRKTDKVKYPYRYNCGHCHTTIVRIK